MTDATTTESVRYWRPEGLTGVEILHEDGSFRECAYFFETYTLAAAIEIHADARYRQRSYTLTSRSVHLGEPGELYATLRQHRPCSLRVVRLDASVVEEAAYELGYRGAPHFSLQLTHDQSVYASLLHVHRSLVEKATLLEQQTLLVAAVHLILGRYGERRLPQAGALDRRGVERARDYLHAHWNEDVTLDDLARAAQHSKCYLADRFRHTFGLPPHAYQIQVRVARAQHLLASGERISDVALQTGFADQAHLTRHFKRLFRVTPGEYLKNRKIVQDTLPSTE